MAEMKKVAVLVDAGYVLKNLYRLLKRNAATADDAYAFCLACVNEKDEDLLRVYYYDCPPYDGVVRHPITGERIDFGKSDTAKERTALLSSLAVREKIACRFGTLRFRGWEPTLAGHQKLKRGQKLESTDLMPSFDQKQIDVKIGLDVAWLSGNRIVDKIILATADTDFTPAMKFARQSGVTIVLAKLQGATVHQELLEHSDEHRVVPFPPVGRGKSKTQGGKTQGGKTQGGRKRSSKTQNNKTPKATPEPAPSPSSEPSPAPSPSSEPSRAPDQKSEQSKQPG